MTEHPRHPSRRRRPRALLAALCASFLVSGAVLAADPRDDPALAGARLSLHRETGLVRFLGGTPGRPALRPSPLVRADPVAAAVGFVELYGSAFGVDEPASQLSLERVWARAAGGASLRYRQRHQGLPVIAGELIVNVDASGALLSMNGELAPELDLPTTPVVTEPQARTIARRAVRKWYGSAPGELQISRSELSIYDSALIAPVARTRALVWRLEVRSDEGMPVRELVLVDAVSGAIALHFDQIHRARDRDTYDAGGGPTLPGTLVCSEADPFPACAGGDADVEDAHDYAGDTYDFYSTNHGRDGIDGVGGPIVSTVHWNDGASCPNAFWNGLQMIYCDGLAEGDDVVAHELTHGVTDSESGLFYYYQSGAINESLSDVWGELVDLANGKGDDSTGVRWLIGEDVSAIGGAIRDMRDPTAFGDPDRMTSPNYWTASTDAGGVHANSGVNNKATYLMTDGDTFNSITVTGLGETKVAQIYYEAQTNLLTTGSDYADLYDILFQACVNLIGTGGITGADCDEVRDATDAVEMNLDPAGDPAFSPEADPCPSGSTVDAITFSDDMEVPGNWSTSTLSGTSNPWAHVTGYAHSGVLGLYAPNKPSTSDSVAFMTTPVVLPAGAYLHFHHAFGFEASQNRNWDGGVLEYSTDGSTWLDMGGLFDDGQDYGGTIATQDTNPLGGRSGFVAESHGYVSSRYDLSSLAGQSFQLRFRIGSDSIVAGPLGWIVDDVSIHTCAAADPSCSGTDVSIQNRTFDADAICLATSTLTADPNVAVDPAVTVLFVSPLTALGEGFSVAAGGSLEVRD